MLTHQSVNSGADLRAIIRSQEQQHWYAGLRQAELEAEKLRGFLQQFSGRRWWWQWRKLLALMRDGKHQLAVALEEKERILAEHPEALQGYEQGQVTFANEARLAHLESFMAARLLSQTLGLPDSVGEALLRLTPEERQRVMQRSQERVAVVTHQLLPPIPAESPDSLPIPPSSLLRPPPSALPHTPHPNPHTHAS